MLDNVYGIVVNLTGENVREILFFTGDELELDIEVLNLRGLWLACHRILGCKRGPRVQARKIFQLSFINSDKSILSKSIEYTKTKGKKNLMIKYSEILVKLEAKNHTEFQQLKNCVILI